MELVHGSVRRRGVGHAAAAGLVVALLMSTIPLGWAPPARAADDAAATVIARYRERIPELMDEQAIPGLAVALVDRNQALWVEGFGSTDRDGSPPVTADTIFSVESMSKLFTATAVMQAVAAGRLDLDASVAQTSGGDARLGSALRDASVHPGYPKARDRSPDPDQSH